MSPKGRVRPRTITLRCVRCNTYYRGPDTDEHWPTLVALMRRHRDHKHPNEEPEAPDDFMD